MPWGHRRCPPTAASSIEGHPAEGGCSVDRRLIDVRFIDSLRQRRTPRRPRRSPGTRRCRTTPGQARRRGRRGWLLCCWWRSNAALPRKPKIDIPPFHPQREPARASPVDHCRHWRRSAMVRRASAAARDEGGGASGRVASFSFWQCGRSLWCCRFSVLPLAFVRGLSTRQFSTKAVSRRDPRFGSYRVIL